MRKLKSLSKSARWRFTGLGVLLVMAAVVSFLALRPDYNPELAAQHEAAEAYNTRTQTEAAERVAAENERVATIARCLGAPTRDASTGCAGKDLGDKALPKTPADDAKVYCWTSEGNETLDSCKYGSREADAKRIAVVGDSHARHLMPGLEAVADAEKWAIDSYLGNGCSLTVAPLEACTTANTEILHSLTQGDPYAVVVVSVSRRKPVDAEAVTTAIRQVQATGAKVVIMEDVPTTTPEAIACAQAATFDVKTTRCGVAAAGMKADTMVELGRGLGIGVGIISPYFCDPDWCPAVIGNAHVYADEGAHLTATYSRTLGPYVAAAIKTAAQL